MCTLNSIATLILPCIFRSASGLSRQVECLESIHAECLESIRAECVKSICAKRVKSIPAEHVKSIPAERVKSTCIEFIYTRISTHQTGEIMVTILGTS
jgi:hypothetical protein